MNIEMFARPISWELTEPFRIARGEMRCVDAVVVELRDSAGRVGRGEAYGIPYEGENVPSMMRDIDCVRDAFLARPDRSVLLQLLPAGGARCALDCALWDLEAKQAALPAWRLAQLPAWKPLVSAFTIGMRSAANLMSAAAARADYPVLKIKVGADAPLEIVRIVRAAAPAARLIVDANQSWTFEQLKEYAPACRELGVVLLEQPVAAEADADLLGYACPVPICADEVVHTIDDLPKLVGKYNAVNIKLDKSGGLTAALALARSAREQGFRLMVGCMAGSSLAMAPAMIVGQLCEFVDLDGPLLQRHDWPHALQYTNGTMSLPEPSLWG